MKKYNVKITSHALRDMEDIYNYIAFKLCSPDSAMRQYNRIAEKIESLCTMPERFQLMNTDFERDKGVRQLLVDKYSAIYVVGDSDVTILRVLYSSSDLSARLQDNN